MARSPPRNLTALIFRPRHDYLPGAEILRQIDVDALAERLEIEARGEADGRAERPGETDRGRTSAEADIQGALRDIWDETLKGAKRAQEGLRGRFASLTAETELDSLLAEPAAVGLALREVAREERDRLLSQHAVVREAADELSRFREREGLTRPVREPGSAVTKLALLAFAALVELIVNASIFAGGEEFRAALAAVTKVVVIPIANLGGCFVLTHWLARQVLARAPACKAVGVMGCVLTAAWLSGLNLAVAHWRDASGAPTSPQVADAALQALFSAPLRLRSFQSWGLFIVGCFAGVVAIWEGWSWWDPHPGYSRRARAEHSGRSSVPGDSRSGHGSPARRSRRRGQPPRRSATHRRNGHGAAARARGSGVQPCRRCGALRPAPPAIPRRARAALPRGQPADTHESAAAPLHRKPAARSGDTLLRSPYRTRVKPPGGRGACRGDRQGDRGPCRAACDTLPSLSELAS